MHIIPLSRLPAQSCKLALPGGNCTLSLYWRQKRLYLDLAVADAEAGQPASGGEIFVCRGAICQNRAELIQSPSRHFSGSLHFFDQEGKQPPHWQGLYDGASGRWVLLYLEEGEGLPEAFRY